MSGTTLLRCANCGAPLRGATAPIVTCTYCGQELARVGGAVEARGSSASPLSDELLAGYQRDVGAGRRLTAPELGAPAWSDAEYQLWPVSGRASSSFGMGWSASAVVGPPRVFPRSGDRRGAWAPGSRDSKTEWIEAAFPPGPAARAVRVYETCQAGATFAVTVTSESGTDLVYEGASGLLPEARVLEIRLDPPRPIRAVRAYVNNDLGSSWAEIDTIGLVTVEAVPEGLRPRPRSRKSLALVALSLGAVGLIIAVSFGRKTGTAPSSAGAASLDTPMPRNKMMSWKASVTDMESTGTRWATRIEGASSEYEPDRNPARAAAGRPDVYPEHLDDPKAWASRRKSAGLEWISAAFEPPVRASAVVVVETLNPGALARIVDESGPEPVTLWAGTTSPVENARALSLELASPREISRVRIELDTGRVAGWNAIDAVGLVVVSDP